MDTRIQKCAFYLCIGLFVLVNFQEKSFSHAGNLSHADSSNYNYKSAPHNSEQDPKFGHGVGGNYSNSGSDLNHGNSHNQAPDNYSLDHWKKGGKRNGSRSENSPFSEEDVLRDGEYDGRLEYPDCDDQKFYSKHPDSDQKNFGYQQDYLDYKEQNYLNDQDGYQHGNSDHGNSSNFNHI